MTAPPQAQRAEPDTVGLIVGASPRYGELLEQIKSPEWRSLICVAIDSDCLFIGCGHPHRPDGSGCYAIVRSPDLLPEAIAIVHQGVGDKGSRLTMWAVVAEPDVEKVAYSAIAAMAPTEGNG